MSDLASLLHTTFGFPAFRANQEAVCRAATDGRDCLLVMPTGAGKSLCYQLPAIARGGTGLVISPLIALMDDQANKLSVAGLRVARIHSGLSREDARQACRDYLDGKLQFLFIAPERMRVPGFPEMLARRKPSLIAIDEAHCISAWGHDFRPDYRTLGDFLPALRPAPVIALTATATTVVQKDIAAQLHLQHPALFIHGFRRENLAIEVVELSKPRRSEFTVKFLSDPARRPAIVYAPSRRTAEELASELGRKFPAAAYHAGLTPEVRERVQRHFLGGKLEVVVATIAFGMGIDKADVRSVVHFALPASVEAFYQEIGRAGRDGLPARTVLLYSFVDKRIHESFLERDYPEVTDLVRVAKALNDEFLMPEYIASKLRMDRDVVAKSLEKLAAQGAVQFDMGGNVRLGANAAWQAGYAQQVEFRRSQIDRMMQFAETRQCRMTALIRHFGDTADGHRPCGHCDFCAPSAESARPFRELNQDERQQMMHILRALEGQGRSNGKLYTELSTGPLRGTPAGKDRHCFDSLLDGLSRAGLISVKNEQWTNPEGELITFKKVTLTHEGREALEQGAASLAKLVIQATEPTSKGKSAKAPRKSKAETLATSYTPAQTRLHESLRAWRKAEAAKTGKPAFMVSSDAVLHQIVLGLPKTLPALLEVHGVGPSMVDRYGAEICALCRGEALPEAAAPAAAPAAATKTIDLSARSERAVQTPLTLAAPRTQTADAAPTFRRERMVASDPSGSLDPAQQQLDARLRAWRKSESEKMGLPQFFVLGTSTLRSIVLSRPQTLSQLKSIQGIDPEKLDKFGPSILAVCNG